MARKRARYHLERAGDRAAIGRVLDGEEGKDDTIIESTMTQSATRSNFIDLTLDDETSAATTSIPLDPLPPDTSLFDAALSGSASTFMDYFSTINVAMGDSRGKRQTGQKMLHQLSFGDVLDIQKYKRWTHRRFSGS